MKILGCVKAVPDLDLIMDEDWRADGSLSVDTSYAKLIWNCFDEGALEMMLRLSDLSESLDVVYELNALIIGKQKQESFLKTLYALGFVHGTRICTEEDVAFSPEFVAEQIAQYVKETALQDVIVTGVQSSDGSNSKTPYLIAEKLGWPCITQVIGMEPLNENTLKVISQVPGGRLEQVVKIPCVLAVGNAPCAYLRIPTLKAKMKFGKRPIEQIELSEYTVKGHCETSELVALKYIDRKRNTVVIRGDTPQEKAKYLYEVYLKDRSERQ
ncbi:MAG: electron transfer flavoprotein subunit beta/FixA family protein [Lachnospiraceae bacterium]